MSSYSDLIPWLLSLGLAGIACLAILEKLIPIVPSYALLMLIGIAAPDSPTLMLAIVATAIGSTIGTHGWYGLGYAVGPRRAGAVVDRFGKYMLLDPARYERITSAYHRNPFTVTFAGQLIPIVRVYLALPAGMLRLEPRVFLAATALGCLIWNASFLMLGHILPGTDRERILAGCGLAVLFILAETMILLVTRARKQRRR